MASHCERGRCTPTLYDGCNGDPYGHRERLASLDPVYGDPSTVDDLSAWLDDDGLLTDGTDPRDYLTRYGDFRVPCSRYGTSSRDIADVVVRAVEVLARESSDYYVRDVESLDYVMRLAVNDHADVAYTLTSGDRAYVVVMGRPSWLADIVGYDDDDAVDRVESYVRDLLDDPDSYRYDIADTGYADARDDPDPLDYVDVSAWRAWLLDRSTTRLREYVDALDDRDPYDGVRDTLDDVEYDPYGAVMAFMFAAAEVVDYRRDMEVLDDDDADRVAEMLAAYRRGAGVPDDRYADDVDAESFGAICENDPDGPSLWARYALYRTDVETLHAVWLLADAVYRDADAGGRSY